MTAEFKTSDLEAAASFSLNLSKYRMKSKFIISSVVDLFWFFVSFTKAGKSILRVRRKLIYTVQTHWIRNVTVKVGFGMMHEDGATKINCLEALNVLL